MPDRPSVAVPKSGPFRPQDPGGIVPFAGGEIEAGREQPLAQEAAQLMGVHGGLCGSNPGLSTLQESPLEPSWHTGSPVGPGVRLAVPDLRQILVNCFPTDKPSGACDQLSTVLPEGTRDLTQPPVCVVLLLARHRRALPGPETQLEGGGGRAALTCRETGPPPPVGSQPVFHPAACGACRGHSLTLWPASPRGRGTSAHLGECLALLPLLESGKRKPENEEDVCARG